MLPGTAPSRVGALCVEALVRFLNLDQTLSVPTQVSIRKIKVSAMRLESGDADDAIDSGKDFRRGRRDEQNRNVAIRFAEQNIGNCGLLCLHATAQWLRQ